MKVPWRFARLERNEGLLAGASPCCTCLYVFCLSRLESQNLGQSTFSLLDGDSGCAASVVVLLDKDSERRVSLSLQAEGSERGPICCCLKSWRLKTNESVAAFPVVDSRLTTCRVAIIAVIASSLMGHRFRTSVSVSVSLDVPETQKKECLLEGCLYPFQMRRRLQFSTSPFPCCDWLFSSEQGNIVWLTLLSSCGSYLQSPNTKLEKWKMSLKFYLFISHFPNHNHAFGNVPNALSPNMMEKDWTVLHALICLLTSEFVLDVALHIQHYTCWSFIHFKVWKHRYEWIWMDLCDLSRCFSHCCTFGVPKDFFMAVKGQNLRNQSLGGWRVESPFVPGLCTRGLLLAL